MRQANLKVGFIGSNGAGKRTLIKALKGGWLDRISKNKNQSDNFDCETEGMIGFNVMKTKIAKVGRVSLYNFQSQRWLQKAYNHFFSSNSFFVLLVSLLVVTGKEKRVCKDKELRDELQYYLSLLIAGLDGKFIPTVLVMASRGDYYRDGQHLLQRVVNNMRELFKREIDIIQECLVLDCRQRKSPEIKQLKKCLRDMKRRLEQVIMRSICGTCLLVNTNVYCTVWSSVSSSLSASCVQVASFSS